MKNKSNIRLKSNIMIKKNYKKNRESYLAYVPWELLPKCYRNPSMFWHLSKEAKKQAETYTFYAKNIKDEYE